MSAWPPPEKRAVPDQAAEIATIGLVFLISMLMGCRPRQDGVERRIEDQAEVLLNHLEPTQIKGKPSQPVLEEELRIDFEKAGLDAMGPLSPEAILDVDSEGSIYLCDRLRTSDHCILKFDKGGRFEKPFGRKGQGPAEIQNPTFMRIGTGDRIFITDYGNKKILVFDKDSILAKEQKYDSRWSSALLLENGNFLATEMEEGKPGELRMILALFRPDFKMIKELDSFDMTPFLPNKRSPFGIPLFYWRVKGWRIYLGNEKRGYEIRGYDFDGKLLRKVRKEYRPVRYPEEYKKSLETMLKTRPNTYLLDFTPPFNSFFIDDDSRLFVMTYEQPEDKEAYIHDIFNAEGVFIGRQSLGLSGMLGQALNPRWAVARNNRYYRLRFKESGYAELIVYKMIWN